jgi:hypothetical protein
MRTHAAPADGDVVVRPDTRDGRTVYVLCTAAGVGQYLLRSRDDAVSHAVAFATLHGVRAWLAGETPALVPLNDLRAVVSV